VSENRRNVQGSEGEMVKGEGERESVERTRKLCGNGTNRCPGAVAYAILPAQPLVRRSADSLGFCNPLSIVKYWTNSYIERIVGDRKNRRRKGDMKTSGRT
jgi:hypothetical protein